MELGGIAAWQYGLALGVGIIAGVINTLAGAGSLITLPLLLLMGLTPHEANATNRLGVIFQSLSGLHAFRRHGQSLPPRPLWYIVPATLGAIIGALIAATVHVEVVSMKPRRRLAHARASPTSA